MDTVDSTWFQAYGALTLGCAEPVLHALQAYVGYVHSIVCEYDAEHRSELHNLPWDEYRDPGVLMALMEYRIDPFEYAKIHNPDLCHVTVACYGQEILQRYGMALEFVKEQTPELCLTAVTQDGMALRFVKEQTAELCLAAVTEYGWALEFVEVQTPEICLAAVRQNGSVLQYVHTHTMGDALSAIYLAAVQNTRQALHYISHITPEIQAFLDKTS